VEYVDIFGDAVQGSDSELEGSDMDGIQSHGEMGLGKGSLGGARRGKE